MKDLLLITLILAAVSIACSSTPSGPKAQWTAMTKIAGKEKGLAHIASLAADETSVYTVIGGTVADQKEGTNGLRKVDIKTGEVTMLENGDKFPQSETGGIAIDDKYVYWNGGGNIMKIAKSGGKAEAIVTEKVGIGIDMATDGVKVYWANHGYYSPGQPTAPGAIYAVPVAGGPAEVIADGQMAQGNVALDDKYVYWTTYAGVMRRAKSGGAVETVLAIGDKEGVDKLAVDTESVYFGYRGAGESRWALKKVAKGGGEPVILAKTFSAKEFVVTEAAVYFFDEEGMSDDVLCKISKNGGDITKLDRGYARGAIGQNKTNIFLGTLDDIYTVAK